MLRLFFILLVFVVPQLKGEMVLYCTFDSIIEPSISDSIKSIPVEYKSFSVGKKGKSIILDDQQPQLKYISEKPFFTDSGSLEIWLKPLCWEGIDKKDVIDLRLKANEDLHVRIFKDANSSNFFFQSQNRDSSKTLLAPIYDLYKNKWMCILITKKNNEISFFCDGQKAIESDRPEQPLQSEESKQYSFSISCKESTAIDELRIYDESFTDKDARERYISSLLGEKSYVLPTIRIPYTKNPPVKDGAIDPNSWDNAAVIGNFINMNNAAISGLQTWVYMMYDDNHVYFMYKSPVTNEGLTGGPRGRDVLGGGDEVELYLMPKYTETFDYFQFIGNPWNSIFDSKGLNDRKWDGNWFYRTQLDSQSWMAEIWINDCSLMAVNNPSEKTEWKVNFCRNWRTGDGAWTQWSFTPGVYHNYQQFGKLIFSSKEPVYIRVVNLADIDQEKKTMTANFEVVNDSSEDRLINVKYDFYSKGDYLPTSTISKQITSKSLQKQLVTIGHQLQTAPLGTIEILVQDAQTGDVYLQQMVKVDNLK